MEALGQSINDGNLDKSLSKELMDCSILFFLEVDPFDFEYMKFLLVVALLLVILPSPHWIFVNLFFGLL